ncbi:septin-12 isoform X1 [Eublepharis macularius]|uniref:Septin-12 isoform X1 n=2 Tax=Eublepharis macularius TaxID=481883 RepID=A0AA97LB66_EUBMA|nr:septin-12 isoform X1 [Eublepharis macularius]
MSQLSVKEHLDGILSDFEALKRSFEMEDAEDSAAFSPSSPPHSPLGPCLPGIILATGNGEGHRAGGPLQPSYQSRISLSSNPSPAQSPVLKTRISSSLSFNRGTVHPARANGSHLTRVSSFQTRLNPNGFSSSLGPGSDNESLHSSSSSLECPTPLKSLHNVTQQSELPGIGVSQLSSPMLKKFFSHGNVFHAEADQSIQQVSNCGSLPSLDLHIAEDQGANPTLYPPLSTNPAVMQSSSDHSCIVPPPKNSTSTRKESTMPPLEMCHLAHVSPPAPAARQTVKLQKFPISLDGLIEKTPEGAVLTPAPESVPKPSPRAQIHVNLSTSPGLSRQPTEITKDRAVPIAAGFTSPSPGQLPGTAGSASPPQVTSFWLVSQSQAGQVASQPSRGSPPMGPAQGAPATPSPRGHGSAAARSIDSIPGQEGSQPQAPAPTPGSREEPLTLANRPPEASSEKKESQREDLLKEESHSESLWISMEAQPSQLQQPPDGPGTADRELFGYVGIEAVIDQMRIKTMKTGFEFNIMVVGQSGLGKSTMVNTLFKSKVSRKSSCPGYEERIPKTVKLLSVTHVIEEKGVKMKLTVTDTPGFGDQINNQNCWEPILEYISDQYERYLGEEILINRKRKIPDTRVHACVYFVPPTGHWLRPLDLEFMRRLNKITNVVPVIAKADTLTLEERAVFKQRIQKDLKDHNIHVYPQEEFDNDSDDRFLNDKIREKIPFAVVGADKEHQVNGKKVLGRKTKWGIIEVENPAHCEFPLLRDLLIRSHLQDLKDITHNVHYEQYRMNRLNESNLKAKGGERLGSASRDPESHL